MSSSEICTIMERTLHKWYPDTQITSVPVADGGEGSVDAFLTAVGGEKIHIIVKGPYFEDIKSFYGILPDGTAVVEMAAAAGLPLVGERLHAEQTTTYGVGQLILHAVGKGCRRVILGLGGSCTNDGGAGAAAALGAVFTDREGKSFIPVGATLKDISGIDLSGIRARLENTEIIAMCDIDNPLCGPNGAAAVFGPQKGADAETVKLLDEGLSHMAGVIRQNTELGGNKQSSLQDIGANHRVPNILDLPGAGAAGGFGGGAAAFLGARLQMGIDTVLDVVSFDTLLSGADLVITGEGKIDQQSLRGKVVVGIARKAKKAGVPVVAVVGDIGDNVEEAYDIGVTAIFSINRMAIPFSQARTRSRQDLEAAMDNLARFMHLWAK
jgi:glycerate kinase